MTAAEPGAASGTALAAELANTLDVLVDQSLVGVALFGDAQPAIGRYTIERRLGAGSSAVVYAARDTTLDRPVALKIVAARDADGAWRARAHREARALARLSHPHVVAVHDVGEWRGHPFIAMELVVGVTLARWQADAVRPWPEILRRYLAAGRGLEAAHSVGLVHRDFKPANVLVADTGRVVVTDFGLAALVEPAESASAAQGGTPAYLAPEQRAGVPPRPCADVYSFSLALCEALVGRHPLFAPALDWRRALARAALPPGASAAIERGMAADPEHRWPLLGPLLAALEAALVSRVRRRRGAVGAAAATAVLGLGLVAGLASVDRRRAAVPRAEVAIALRLVANDPTAAAALLRETPPSQRGDDWATAVRAVLLRPLARELRCLDGRPRSIAHVAEGVLAAVDAQGRAIACELAAERATMLAEAATCTRVLGGDHVGVLTADGTWTVFDRRAGWRPRGRISIGMPSPGAPSGAARCDRDVAVVGPHVLAVRRDGATWQLVGLPTLAVVGSIDAGSADRVVIAVSRDLGRALLQDEHLWTVPVAAAGGPHARLLAYTWAAVADPISGLAMALEGEVGSVIDVGRGEVVRSEIVGRVGLPSAVFAISPHARWVVAGTRTGELRWWAVVGASRAPWLESVSEAAIAQIAFNRSGTRLVWRDVSGGIGVRDVDRARGYELHAGERSICDAGFDTDDRVVAVRCDGRVLAWDLAEDQAVLSGRHDLAAFGSAFDDKSTAIWSASLDATASVVAAAPEDGTVRLWPIDRSAQQSASRHLPIRVGRQVFAARFFGERLLVGLRDSAAQVWNWRTGTRLGELPGHETWVYAFAVAQPAEGPATIVTGAKSGTVRFWSADGLRLLATTVVSRLGTRANDLATSPNGRLVAVALDSGQVGVLDVAKGALIAPPITAHQGWARVVVFLDDTTLLSAGDDGLVRVIALPSGTITRTIRAHDGPIYALDRLGDRLLTASGDGKIRLWDLRDGTLVRTYVGHEQLVGAVRWHADGTRFASASRDGRACIWRIERDTCHDWLIGHRGEVRVAEFAGDRVVTASTDGTVRIWTPVTAQTIESLAAELDRRAPACLDEHRRVAYLGEQAYGALARAGACRRAAP